MTDGEITIAELACRYGSKHGKKLSYERYRQILRNAHLQLKKLLLENPKTKELITQAHS